MRKFSLLSSLSLLATLLCSAQSTKADQLNYYIGVDSQQTLVQFPDADPTYVGLPNPNYGRLTFLYAHWLGPPSYPIQASHWHPRSTYGYTGPASNPTVVADQGTFNQIPEDYTGFPGLQLAPGSGAYAGKLTSFVYADTSEGSVGHYSNLRFNSTAALSSGFTPQNAEYWMYRANDGFYEGSLAGSQIALELVAATPGLHVGIGSDTDIFASSSRFTLGNGNTLDFTPVFWTDSNAASGHYEASFMLTDLNAGTTGFQDSGVFHFEFVVTPEPSTNLLFLCGGAVLLFPILRRAAPAKPRP